MCGIVSPTGGAREVLWAPTSEGSGEETATLECAAGTGLRIDMLLVGGDGDGSEARIPCTGRGSWVTAWVPVWDWIPG